MSMLDGQHPQQPKKPREDAVGFLYTICNAHATCVTPFFRWGFGRDALGWPGIGAFAMLLLWATCNRDGWGFLYFFTWFVALIYQRIQTFKLLRKGVIWHSLYGGFPSLAMKMPFVRTLQTAQVLIEPMFCVIAGALLCCLSTNVGCLVIFAAASLLIRQGIEGEIVRRRVLRMRDAALEQQYISEQFRNGKW